MGLKIRNTKREDLSELENIYRRAYDRPEFGENWSIEAAEALLDFYFNLDTFIGLTAIFDDNIVGGFFSFVKPWHDGNHLGEGELFVDPKYQHQGIGTKLTTEMMKIATEKECVVYELLAYDKVAEWYKKIGMEDSGLHHMSGKIQKILEKLGKMNNLEI